MQTLPNYLHQATLVANGGNHVARDSSGGYSLSRVSQTAKEVQIVQPQRLISTNRKTADDRANDCT